MCHLNPESHPDSSKSHLPLIKRVQQRNLFVYFPENGAAALRGVENISGGVISKKTGNSDGS